MSDFINPLVKFSYTILNPDGTPHQKSWIINLSYVLSIEASGQNDLKVFMSNDQVVNIELGNEMNNDEVMDEILSMSAAGNDYSVYRINAYYK